MSQVHTFARYLAEALFPPYLIKASRQQLQQHLFVNLCSPSRRAGLIGIRHQGLANLLQGFVVGVSGVAAAPLLPGVFRHHYSSTPHVHLRWVRRPGHVPETLPNFLQHLVAVNTVVASRESLRSHLSISFGFLPSLHVRTCRLAANGENKRGLRGYLGPRDGSRRITLHLHPAEYLGMTKHKHGAAS